MAARKRKPRILLDCDGVLADFIGGVLWVVWRRTGIQLEPTDFPHGEIFKQLGNRDPKLRQLASDAILEKDFCESLDVLPKAQEGVRKLQEAGLEIFIVTSPVVRSRHWVYERYEWLARHFGIRTENVLFTQSKHIVQGDIFIDDRHDHVEDWTQHQKTGTGFIWETLHNRHVGEDLQRLRSWEELHEILRIK